MHYVRFLVPAGLVLALFTMPGQGQDKKSVEYDSPFYPLGVGSQWRYKATVGDNPQQQVVVTVEHKEPFEYKIVQDKNKKEVTESITRFRVKVTSLSKELTEHVAVLKDGAYRFSTAGKDITPPLRFLKLPLTQGETWTVESKSENVDLKGTFRCDDETVTVPAGKYQSKHVSSVDFQLGTEKMALDFWFALDVGIVKQRVVVANSEVVLELEAYKAGK
jgi:hypothetical protein